MSSRTDMQFEVGTGYIRQHRSAGGEVHVCIGMH